MKIHTENVILPAYWASALINGDYSGCEDSEEKEINEFLADNPHYGECRSYSDYPDIGRYNNLLCDVLTYTFSVNFYRVSDNGLNYIVYPSQTKDTVSPVSYSRTGYGSKIPTSKMVLLLGVWRRVYCTIYSNSGTCWVNFEGKKIIVNSLF